MSTCGEHSKPSKTWKKRLHFTFGSVARVWEGQTSPKQPGESTPEAIQIKGTTPQTSSIPRTPQGPTTTYKCLWTLAVTQGNRGQGPRRFQSYTASTAPPTKRGTAITAISRATSPITALRRGKKPKQPPPKAGKCTTGKPPPWCRRSTRRITPSELMQRSPQPRPPLPG